MNRVGLVVGLLAVLVLAVCLAAGCAKQSRAEKPAQEPAPAAPEIVWLTSTDDAAKKSAETGKPILIDFTAEWCGWCKKLDEDTYTDGWVRQEAERFIPLRVDVDKDQAFAQKFQISGMPTIVFTDSNFKELHRFEGYKPAPGFLEEMKKVKA